MTVSEWSCFAKQAFAHAKKGITLWAFVAGLRALGFGRRVLREASSNSPFADEAPPDQPGILLEFSPSGEIAAPPEPGSPPVFSVPSSEKNDYIDVVAWLIEQGAISAVVVKED